MSKSEALTPKLCPSADQVTFASYLLHHFMSRGSPQSDRFENHAYHQSMQYHHELLQNSLDLVEITIFYNFRCSLETYAIPCFHPMHSSHAFVYYEKKRRKYFVYFVLFVFCMLCMY